MRGSVTNKIIPGVTMPNLPNLRRSSLLHHHQNAISEDESQLTSNVNDSNSGYEPSIRSNSPMKGRKKKSKGLKKGLSFLASQVNNPIMVGISKQMIIMEGQSLNDDYKVIKKIGSGGVGEVFLVLHLETD